MFNKFYINFNFIFKIKGENMKKEILICIVCGSFLGSKGLEICPVCGADLNYESIFVEPEEKEEE